MALVMLAQDGKVISQRISDTERDHAGKINLLVDDVLAEAGLSLPQIDAVAVCNGPGSYTGLRIGLATAKGYCYVLNKPLILHNRLSLMLSELKDKEVKESTNKIALLPARLGEYYWTGIIGGILVPPEHITTEALISKLALQDYPLAMIGQANDDITQLQIFHNIHHDSLDVNGWSAITYSDFLAGKLADTAYAEPEYLKSAYITSSRTDR
jgi:tRNA threonylcarbamoyladenosine biosynthesis protein TsaB